MKTIHDKYINHSEKYNVEIGNTQKKKSCERATESNLIIMN